MLQPLDALVEAALLAEAEAGDDRLQQLVRRGQADVTFTLETFTLELSPEWVLTTMTGLIVGAADSLRLGRLAPTDLQPYLHTTILSVTLRR